MYHFDYVGKSSGVVFEGIGGGLVSINGKTKFSFDDFISIFVLIENYKHPFTICTTQRRSSKIDKFLKKSGYSFIKIKQIDHDLEEENAFIYGVYQKNRTNPFQYMNFVEE